jgi:hypothetical protein
MPATIVTPTIIENPILEETLVVQPNEDIVKGRISFRTSIPEELPSVTLGQPQYWNLADLAREKGEKIPAEFALMLREADFFLVLLSISLQPTRNSRFDWARLQTYLRPKETRAEVIAFDLFPRDLTTEIKQDFKISISPSLKFKEVEASVGEVVTNVEYVRTEPIITAYNPLRADPNWDLEKHKYFPLRGSKFLYMIVKRPRGAKGVRLSIELTARFTVDQGFFDGKFSDKSRDTRSRLICTD